MELLPPVTATVSAASHTHAFDVAPQEEPEDEETVCVCEEEDASVVDEPEPAPSNSVDEGELDLLSRIIYAEAGSEWIPDEIQLYVGSVVLNRVASPLYPNSISEVIYQAGQYGPVASGAIHCQPDDRTISNAARLLSEGSMIPGDVLYQALFPQGDGIWLTYYDSVLNTTTYFCYGG
jgi:spore germination cell wall hydrolase CwlJ-like protein